MQQLEAGVKYPVWETIHLEQWLPHLVNRFQVKNALAFLQLLIAPDLPQTVVTDAASLERILVELLGNACKYTSNDAQITVTASLKSSSIQLQVINQGVEIPATELPRIFDKFYRLPSNDPWKHSGTGLGLALVQKLLEHMGGTISVESDSCQTCFIIELPLHPPSLPAFQSPIR